MKKLLFLLLFLLISTSSFAMQPGLIKIEEADGSPSGWVYRLIVSNGTLSISGNKAILSTGGGTNYVPQSLFDAGTILYAVTDDTPAALSISGDVLAIFSAANNAAIKVLLGLTVNTDVQAYSSILDTLAAGGENNTIFGKSYLGAYGYFANTFSLLVAWPDIDGKFTGVGITLVAGESLIKGDIVYCKNKSNIHACYKYDARGADKARPPSYLATADIAADDYGVFLKKGTIRWDAWIGSVLFNNQDEGKLIYADPANPGKITCTKPTTTGDMVAILGKNIDLGVIDFDPSPILVEVP